MGKGFDETCCLTQTYHSKCQRPRNPMLKIYTYANCSTCRRAVKLLCAKKLAFEELPIRETPPSVAELKTMLGACGNDPRRICNMPAAV